MFDCLFVRGVGFCFDLEIVYVKLVYKYFLVLNIIVEKFNIYWNDMYKILIIFYI